MNHIARSAKRHVGTGSKYTELRSHFVNELLPQPPTHGPTHVKGVELSPIPGEEQESHPHLGLVRGRGSICSISCTWFLS